MNSMIGCSRLLVAALCGFVVAGCNAVDDVQEEPFTATPSPTVVLQGTVTGLGSRRPVVLQNNGNSTGARNFFGTVGQSTSHFSFGSLAAGSPYSVTVKTQPFGKICTVANGTGVLGAAGSVPITVTCAPNPAVPRYFVRVSINAAARDIPGLKVILTTEEGVRELPATGLADVTFDSAIFNSLSSLPIFKWYVTATIPGARATDPPDNCRVTGSTNDAGDNTAAPTGNVTTVAVASCRFTIGGTVGYSQPAGVTYTPQAISGLVLELRDTTGVAKEALTIPAFTPAAAATTANFTFQTQWVSNLSAVYDVVVKTQPTGQACVVSSGASGVNASIAQLATIVPPAVALDNITNLSVRCRAIPALANRLTGVYQRDPPAPTTTTPNPPRPRLFLALFEDGTFLYGVHGSATFGSSTNNNVEQGFYAYNAAAGTVAFTILTDVNTANSGLSNPVTGSATGNAAQNATGVVKTASALGQLALSFTATVSGAPVTTVWNMTEPSTIPGQLTGAWVTADHRRMWIYDALTTYGFHAGANGMGNLQEACYVLDDPAVQSGFLFRRGGGTATDPDNPTLTTNCNMGGFGFSSSPEIPSATTSPALLPGFNGRMPGSRSVIDGRPPSPAFFTITSGAGGAPDTFAVQNTLNGTLIETPVIFTRSRPN